MWCSCFLRGMGNRFILVQTRCYHGCCIAYVSCARPGCGVQDWYYIFIYGLWIYSGDVDKGFPTPSYIVRTVGV